MAKYSTRMKYQSFPPTPKFSFSWGQIAVLAKNMWHHGTFCSLCSCWDCCSASWAGLNESQNVGRSSVLRWQWWNRHFGPREKDTTVLCIRGGESEREWSERETGYTVRKCSHSDIHTDSITLRFLSGKLSSVISCNAIQ